MNRSNIKIVISVFLLGILLGISSNVVVAATAESPYGYIGPILGYSYRNKATIFDSYYEYEHGRIETLLETNPSTQYVPTGYMGAQARLFNTSDSLVLSSKMNYTISSTFAVSWGLNITTPLTPGYYYSMGATDVYNGDGYSSYRTFKTPNMFLD